MESSHRIVSSIIRRWSVMYFDDEALNWDTDLRRKRAKILSERISEGLYKTCEMNALDFGCGTGLLSFYLSDKFKSITCADLSEKMLEVLDEKIEISKTNNLNTLSIDKLYSGQFDKKFDVIYSSMVFHHIKDISNEINKLYRLLKDNGSLIIIDLDTVDKLFHSEDDSFDGHDGFERNEISSAFEDCGLKNISIKTVYSGQKIVKNNRVNYSLFLIKGKK